MRTPVIVFSHSPLQKIYKGWNFWTDDAEDVQAMLQPFTSVNVIYGHVHQIQLQSDRQHLLQFRNGHSLALALPPKLCPGGESSSGYSRCP